MSPFRAGQTFVCFYITVYTDRFHSFDVSAHVTGSKRGLVVLSSCRLQTVVSILLPWFAKSAVTFFWLRNLVLVLLSLSLCPGSSRSPRDCCHSGVLRVAESPPGFRHFPVVVLPQVLWRLCRKFVNLSCALLTRVTYLALGCGGIS
jgi:hypothetical protein